MLEDYPNGRLSGHRRLENIQENVEVRVEKGGPLSIQPQVHDMLKDREDSSVGQFGIIRHFIACCFCLKEAIFIRVECMIQR